MRDDGGLDHGNVVEMEGSGQILDISNGKDKRIWGEFV